MGTYILISTTQKRNEVLLHKYMSSMGGTKLAKVLFTRLPPLQRQGIIFSVYTKSNLTFTFNLDALNQF